MTKRARLDLSAQIPVTGSIPTGPISTPPATEPRLDIPDVQMHDVHPPNGG